MSMRMEVRKMPVPRRSMVWCVRMRISCNGAVYWLLGRHWREDSIVSRFGVWLVLVELDLLGSHLVRCFHVMAGGVLV
jgi:hypothetical protein